MAIDKLIPRLEWNPISIVGDRTITSPIITNISDTSLVVVGMIANGTGFTADSVVLSKTANSVTLDNDAASNGVGMTLNLKERFDFEFPPTKDTDKTLDAQEKVTTSLSGARQVQVDFIEEKRAVTFDFLTDSENTELKTRFYIAWSVYGREFNYFPDKADSLYDTYELADFKFTPKRQVKKHPSFLYQLSLSFRKVI